MSEADKKKGAAEFMKMRERLIKLLETGANGTMKQVRNVLKQFATEMEGVSSPGEVAKSFKDGQGRTVAHFAAIKQQVQTCKYLLSLDPTMPNWADDQGATPLMLALSGGASQQLVDMLVEAGGDLAAAQADGNTCLHAAVMAHSADAVRGVLSAGVDVDARTTTGATPLHFAAGEGDVASVQALLEAGADACTTAASGCSALFQATACGSVPAVDALVASGAEVSAAADDAHDCLTPLHVAAEAGAPTLIRSLLRATGAEAACKHRSGLGYTPVECAAAGRFREAVALLLPLSTVVDADLRFAEGAEDATVEGLGPHALATALMASQSRRWELQAEELAAAKAEAERHSVCGVFARDIPAEAVSTEAAERALAFKETGNAAFAEERWEDAAKAYTDGLAVNPGNETLYSNRSAVWLKQGKAEEALRDALTARKLNDKWAKAHLRVAAALKAMGHLQPAADSLWAAVQTDPSNKAYLRDFKRTVNKARAAAQKQ